MRRTSLFVEIAFCIVICSFIAANASDIDTEFKNMSIEELMRVKVVTATKHEEELKDVPSSMVILTRKEIEQRGFLTLSEVLQNIPGLFMIEDKYWLGSTNYGVRGFFSTGPFNDMVVLVNGVSQLSDKYSDYPDGLINVPVESIDRIEVVRGPMSVTYGSGAFFGVINIITDDIKQSKNQATASIGQMGTNKQFFQLSQKIDDLSFNLSSMRYTTKGIDVPFNELTSDPSNMDYVGISRDATTYGQMDDIRKYFGLNVKYKEFYTDISYAETYKDIFDGQPSYYEGSEISLYSFDFVFGYKKALADNFEIDAKYGYYSNSHIIDYQIFYPTYYEVDGQWTHAYDFELNTSWGISDQFTLNSGYYLRYAPEIFQISDFAYYGLKNGDGETRLQKDIVTNSLFTHLTFKPSNNLSIIGGIRVEQLSPYEMLYVRGVVSGEPEDGVDPADSNNRVIYNARYNPENNGINLVTRFALLYNINDLHTIKFMFGEATKRPSFSENYRQLAAGRDFLNSAEIQTYEFNYMSVYSDIAATNFSIYYNHLDNLISATNIYDQTTGEWNLFSSNSGEMETVGFEVLVKLFPTDYLVFDVNFIYQKSNDLREGWGDIKLAYSPEILSLANISYLPTDDISITLINRYIGEMETEWVTSTIPREGHRIGNKSERRMINDINIRYNKIFGSDFFINFKIANLFDVDYRYPTTKSNQWMDKGLPAPGRSMYFTIGYDFE